MRSAARFLRVLPSRTWMRGPSPGDGLVVNGVQESFHPWPGGHRDGICQVRGVSDVEAEHFPAPIGSNPAGGNDRLGHDSVVHPGCAVSRIEGHLGVVQSRQDPVTELYDFSGRDTAQIRFYHDGEQRLINAPSPFQQGRGKASVQSFLDSPIQLTGGRCQHSSAGAVAVGGAIVRAFERGSADKRGRFSFDQLPIERLGGDPNLVGDVGEFQLIEKAEQGNPVSGHRVMSFVSSLDGSHRPAHDARHVDQAMLENPSPYHPWGRDHTESRAVLSHLLIRCLVFPHSGPSWQTFPATQRRGVLCSGRSSEPLTERSVLPRAFEFTQFAYQTYRGPAVEPFRGCSAGKWLLANCMLWFPRCRDCAFR